jgi:hypothetical protein
MHTTNEARTRRRTDEVRPQGALVRVSYTSSRGLFAGVDLNGASVGQDFAATASLDDGTFGFPQALTGAGLDTGASASISWQPSLKPSTRGKLDQ